MADDVRHEQFSAFVGANLPLLVADPSSTLQLASQQSTASPVFDAWDERRQHGKCASTVVDYLNRPQGLPPLVLTLNVGRVSACALDSNGDRVAVGDKDGHVTVFSLRSKGTRLWRCHH